VDVIGEQQLQLQWIQLEQQLMWMQSEQQLQWTQSGNSYCSRNKGWALFHIQHNNLFPSKVMRGMHVHHSGLGEV